ncbi:MAG: DUF1800 domain-containing protein [Gemmatimonadota bacterium]|nr:DUF1800 domain-containing protein [Gemmatimonadota bacterium]
MLQRTLAAAPQLAVALLGLGLLDAVGSAPPDRGLAKKGPHARKVVAAAVVDESAVVPAAGTTDTLAARHLLSRGTFGVTGDDLEHVLDIGIDAWLREQLEPEGFDDEEMAARLARYPAAGMEQDELYERFPPPQVLQRQLRRMGGDRDSVGFDQEAIQTLRLELGVQPPGRILFDLAGAKLQRAVYSERQLEEVMTDFWFNHFNVFFGKAADRWLVGEYEREAIRPHVFGRFEDMLVATARHPAMLFYLDNWTNVAPDSLRTEDANFERLRAMPADRRRRFLERRGVSAEQIEQIQVVMERRRNMQQGINENYARELLELHTLGVDGGYDQDDVIEVARVFTGWGITRPGRGETGPIRFSYQSRLHDPTDKQVLGETVRGSDGMGGMKEGLDVLARLAVHPSTARHLATKLAVAFVADRPPEGLVEELESVFLETGGDLRAMTFALFSSPHFYDPALYGAKLKTPFELVASALRVSDATVMPSRPLFETLNEMGELPYAAQPPTGYPDEGEDWSNSGSLLQRVNFAIALAAGQIRGVRVPDPDDPSTVVARVLPGADVTALAPAIADELQASGTPPREYGRRTLGLALGSPEFQTR